MSWTAVIPLKGSDERKTRLSPHLDVDARRRLSEAMFRHVAGVLRTCPDIAEIALLSSAPPPGWRDGFFPDRGRGLNVELQHLARQLGPRPLLVIHADLPLLSAADVTTLLADAAGGWAIAPDRHETGTNAVALTSPEGFRFEFGPDSYARHIATGGSNVRVVIRPGLATDVDTLEDYDAALSLGRTLHPPSPIADERL